MLPCNQRLWYFESEGFKPVFHFEPCRSEAQRISLFSEHQSGTNDFDTNAAIGLKWKTGFSIDIGEKQDIKNDV